MKDFLEQAMKVSVNVMTLPINVFTDSMGTILSTAQELQKQAAAAAEAESEEPVVKHEREIVPLTVQESALENELVRGEELEDFVRNTLWQIGRSGRSESDDNWASIFDYNVGQDEEPIDSPGIPHLLTTEGGVKSKGGTERLNIHFGLERDYASGELAFIYDRWGAEKDQVFIDDELLTPIGGPGKGKLRHVVIALKDIQQGDHTISLTTSGETEAGGHRIDFFKLVEIEEVEEES